MGGLPVVSGRQILRQQESPFRRITVPDHSEISKGTLRAIIRQAGLSVDELISLL